MTDDVAICVEGLGKSYLIGHRADLRHETFREMISRRVRGVGRGVTDIVRGRQAVAGDEVEEFWALDDVNFEVRRGEVMGIIGRNGAGKSTLLKVLSRITEPTRGRATIRGRVASLLEVGTGFHPELTGRENIFLNGAILGMTRAEIRRSFDEIVEFSEVERFLDTPVKRYSSGMYVRLAFAVAAHLEPEILIVDEVLAVGDGAFQRKCLGKMRDVANGGRTVLFVSHNMGAVRRLCESAIQMEGGRLVSQGAAEEVIAGYYEGLIGVGSTRGGVSKAGFVAVGTTDLSGEPISSIDDIGGSRIQFVIKPRQNSTYCQVAFTIFNSEDIGLVSSVSPEFAIKDNDGTVRIAINTPSDILRNGTYRIEGAVFDQLGLIEQAEHLSVFQMTRTSLFDQQHPDSRGLVRFEGRWEF